MSDSFADEFEKWLQRKNGERNIDETEEGNIDETEEDDNYEESDYAANTACDDDDIDDNESDMEKSSKHSVANQDYRLSSESINDQAPILVDDDDDEDEFLSRRQHFEDEPPVLEPALKQQQDCKSSGLGISHLSPQNYMRSYNRNNHRLFRKSAQYECSKSIKTYSSKDRGKHLSCEKYDDLSMKNTLKSKSIFDKLSSDSYEDFPPPLIPSPDLCPGSPKLELKHPGHSPDFCAMEADSTSEINGDKTHGLLQTRRLSKNSAHGEVVIECDSTCMLAVSPIIVSPASLSSGEIEEVRGLSERGNKDVEKQDSDSNSPKYEDSVCVEAENDKHLSAIQVPGSAVRGIKDADLILESCVKNPDMQIVKTSVPYSCQQLPTGSTSRTICRSFHMNTSIESESDNACEFPSEPPLLSIISPLPRLHNRSRKKRHTIDSAETFSRSRKRSYSIPSPEAENEDAIFDISTPPTLTCVSETRVDHSSRSKRKAVPQHSSLDVSHCLKDRCPRYRRRRQRHNTLPSAHANEYSGHLSKNLCSFVNKTSELSQLQTRMHMLLCYLFPQLKNELIAMSPESYQFGNLLSDFLKSLEQPDEHAELKDSSSPPLIQQVVSKATSVSEAEISFTSVKGYTFQNGTNKPSPQLPDSGAVCTEHTLNSGAASSCTYQSLTLTNDGCNRVKRHSHLKEQWSCSQDCDSDHIISQLSQLTLKEIEEIIRPCRVLLCRDPAASLKRFARLSCRTLQFLLPDLPVSLCSELVGSPHDLVLFIDNVLLTNTRQRAEH